LTGDYGFGVSTTESIYFDADKYIKFNINPSNSQYGEAWEVSVYSATPYVPMRAQAFPTEPPYDYTGLGFFDSDGNTTTVIDSGTGIRTNKPIEANMLKGSEGETIINHSAEYGYSYLGDGEVKIGFTGRGDEQSILLQSNAVSLGSDYLGIVFSSYGKAKFDVDGGTEFYVYTPVGAEVAWWAATEAATYATMRAVTTETNPWLGLNLQNSAGLLVDAGGSVSSPTVNTDTLAANYAYFPMGSTKGIFFGIDLANLFGKLYYTSAMGISRLFLKADDGGTRAVTVNAPSIDLIGEVDLGANTMTAQGVSAVWVGSSALEVSGLSVIDKYGYAPANDAGGSTMQIIGSVSNTTASSADLQLINKWNAGYYLAGIRTIPGLYAIPAASALAFYTSNYITGTSDKMFISDYGDISVGKLPSSAGVGFDCALTINSDLGYRVALTPVIDASRNITAASVTSVGNSEFTIGAGQLSIKYDPTYYMNVEENSVDVYGAGNPFLVKIANVIKMLVGADGAVSMTNRIIDSNGADLQKFTWRGAGASRFGELVEADKIYANSVTTCTADSIQPMGVVAFQTPVAAGTPVWVVINGPTSILVSPGIPITMGTGYLFVSDPAGTCESSDNITLTEHNREIGHPLGAVTFTAATTPQPTPYVYGILHFN
jgi:hypothetical protein